MCAWRVSVCLLRVIYRLRNAALPPRVGTDLGPLDLRRDERGGQTQRIENETISVKSTSSLCLSPTPARLSCHGRLYTPLRSPPHRIESKDEGAALRQPAFTTWPPPVARRERSPFELQYAHTPHAPSCTHAHPHTEDSTSHHSTADRAANGMAWPMATVGRRLCL